MTDKNWQFFLVGVLAGSVLGAALVALFEPLVPVLFGWPVIILSILVPLIGIFLGSPIWVVVGAFLAVPFSLYLGATPRFDPVGFFMPLLHLTAAYAVQRERRWLALLSLIPYLLLAAWLAWTVLNQG